MNESLLHLIGFFFQTEIEKSRIIIQNSSNSRGDSIKLRRILLILKCLN